MTVERFRNRETGLVWAANPGTPEHVRMSSSSQFEPVKPEPAPAKPKQRGRGKPAADPADDDGGGESGE